MTCDADVLWCVTVVTEYIVEYIVEYSKYTVSILVITT